ncbi:Protein SYG1 [Lachancea thermotolerans]
MKFAEHLRESAVPEWIDKYIDYKKGKKKIKACRNTIAASEVLVNNVSTTNSVAMYRDSSSSSRYNSQNVYSPVQRRFVQEFIDKWVIDQELEKCNDFYLWEFKRCSRRFAILREQIERFEAHRTQLTVTESDPKYYGAVDRDERVVPAKSRKRSSWATRTFRTLQDLELIPSLPSMKPFKQLFLDEPDTNSLSVGYGDTFAPSSLTTNQIQHRLSDALIEFYLLVQLIKNYRDINVTGFRKIVKKFDKSCGTRELFPFIEYAKSSYPLFQHAEANARMVAQQIHDSVATRTSAASSNDPNFEDPLVVWEHEVTTWYTDVLSSSAKDRKRKIERIKNLSLEYSLNEQKVHRFNKSILQVFVGGVLMGGSLTLVAYTLWVGFKAPSSSKIHHILLPLWGGWYMVFLITFLFLLNCFIWHRSNVNYRFIMFGEMHSRRGAVLFNNDFSTTQIPILFYFASVLAFPMTLLGALSFYENTLDPFAIIWIVLVSVLFFLPLFGKTPYLNLPYWNKLTKSVRWILVSFVRLIFSGFYPVQFGDFFLGDIFCSLTYSLADIAMFFCIYSPTPNGMCGSSHSKAMGAMTCLPNFWRFMQCLRRFSDSGDWFPHLVNGVKYSMSVLYYASLCAYRIGHTRNRRNVFIIFATLNATCTAIWDIIMDWSLLQPGSKNWLLRDDLYLAGRKNWKTGAYSRKRKSVYYLAMVWDVSMRFQWIVYAIAPDTIQQSAITSLVLAVLEVGRRFVWIIFRVENEHVANVHLFKVSGEATLPFPSTVEGDVETEGSIASNHYAMSEVSYPAMPSPTPMYRGESLQKSTGSNGLLRTLSSSIPWAHAQDFQRPRGFSIVDHSHESDASESEAESML